MNTNTQLWDRIQLQILQGISQNYDTFSGFSNQFDIRRISQTPFNALPIANQNGNANNGIADNLLLSKLAEIENAIWYQVKPTIMSIIHQQVQKEIKPPQDLMAQPKSVFSSKHCKPHSESSVEYDSTSTEIKTNSSKSFPYPRKCIRHAITSSPNLERKANKKKTTRLRILMKALCEKLIKNAINYWKLNLGENDIQEFLLFLKIVKPSLASIYGLKIIFKNNSNLFSNEERMDNKIINKFTQILRLASVKFMEKYYCKWLCRYDDLKDGLRYKSMILNTIQNFLSS